jgi:catechol 2,3-dioxygenase-like lactoylglutathione lyase family enzyme
MQVRRLDHYNIDTAKPEETVAFYQDVLGAVNDPSRRPDFGFPGAWLFLDDHPVIHLNFIDDDRAGPTGAFNHVAFEAEGYLDLCGRLDELGVKYGTNELASSDLLQIFVKDPNNVRLELNFRGECGAVAATRAERG